MNAAIRRLGAGDVSLLRALLGVFAEAFDEADTYLGDQPHDEYLGELLASPDFVAVAAVVEKEVVGGLAGYLLRKFERRRAEFYIYDLAVLEGHRRQGIATALIDELRRVAAELGAYVIFVQADPVDEPAVALYSKLGTREDVLHFDIVPGSAERRRESRVDAADGRDAD